MTVYVVIGQACSGVWIEGIGKTPGVATTIAERGAELHPDKRVLLFGKKMLGPWRPTDREGGRLADVEVAFWIEEHEVHSA